MRVAWFPKTADLQGNPYWSRLQDELEALGAEFECSQASYWIQRRWLLAHRGQVQVLHFHFIQPQYTGADERASYRRLLKFASDLLLARLLGYRLVWTVHDLMPTWPKEPRRVEVWGRYLIAGLVHDVVVHCREARRLVKQRFHRSRRVHVLPVPSYADSHANKLSRAEARAALGIHDSDYVVGFLGGVRPNKGLEDLMAAFRLADMPQSRLLIAGGTWPPESYVDKLRRLAEADPRILLRVERIADEAMQLYLNGADVMVYPFREVLTSSSVILAMSFGRPVIVPRMGCLPELVGEEAGFLYEPGDVAGLAGAIERAAGADLPAMGAAAMRRANVHSWRELATDILRVYERA